jgi:hypothetical protein
LLAPAESAPALAKTVPAPAKSEIVEACPFDAGITPHALLVFGAFHAVPLLGWALSDAPWTWRSAAALVAVGAALVLSAALRRGPSRRLVVCGLGVALVSFSRMVDVDWTLSTWAAFLPTAALAIVLARAAIPPALVAWLSSRMLREAR